VNTVYCFYWTAALLSFNQLIQQSKQVEAQQGMTEEEKTCSCSCIRRVAGLAWPAV